jgi:hypothetical protein
MTQLNSHHLTTHAVLMYAHNQSDRPTINNDSTHSPNQPTTQMCESDRLSISEDAPSPPSKRVRTKRSANTLDDDILPSLSARPYKLSRRDLAKVHDALGVFPVGTIVPLRRVVDICGIVCGPRFPIGRAPRLGIAHAFLENTPASFLTMQNIDEFRIN